MVMNKSLQVSTPDFRERRRSHPHTGCQHPKYECGARGSDVQELPIERLIPPRGYAGARC
jgi:hypothetical protein